MNDDPAYRLRRTLALIVVAALTAMAVIAATWIFVHDDWFPAVFVAAVTLASQAPLRRMLGGPPA